MMTKTKYSIAIEWIEKHRVNINSVPREMGNETAQIYTKSLWEEYMHLCLLL
jgi:hypothetical protein